MQDVKLTRRVVGFLVARLGELPMGRVSDPRQQGKTKWPLPTLLRAVLAGMMAGCKGFWELEDLTAELSPAVRRGLKIRGCLPDTTARDLVVRLAPEEIAGLLREAAKLAYRRKSFVEDMPLSVVSMDGKATAVEELDRRWAQTHRAQKGLAAHGLVRTITCALTSCPLRPVIEAVPMGHRGNEASFFRTAFATLLTHHGAAFEMVTYDAGANTATNAAAVTAAGKHYLFALKGTNRFLLREAKRVLGHKPPGTSLEESEDVLSKRDNVRVLRFLHVAEVPTGYKAMKSVRTVLRVHTQHVDAEGHVLSEENRYFVSSLPHTRLTLAQWLTLVRRHWGVETCHNVLDVAFQEDNRPWVTHSAQGMLVLILLRRLAYTLLALWRGRTLKGDDNRLAAWKKVFAWVVRALEQATQAAFADLRARKAPAFL